MATTVLEYVENVDSTTGFTKCVLDPVYLVGFATRTGQFTPHMRTYKYNADAVFEYSVSAALNAIGEQVAIDNTKTPPLVVSVCQNKAIVVHSYDVFAVLTHIQTVAPTHSAGVGLDIIRNFIFIAELHNGGPALESYPYTDLGVVGAQIDSTPNDSNIAWHVLVDPTLLRVIIIGTEGAKMYSYDVNGDNLTYIGIANAYTSNEHTGGALDKERGLFFSCSDEGLFVYGYSSTGFTAALSSITDKDFLTAFLDTVNNICYATTKLNGLYAIHYSNDGVTLQELSNDHQGDIYRAVCFDVTERSPVGMVVTPTSGIFTYLSRLYTDCGEEHDKASEKILRKFHSKLEITWSDSFIDNTLNAFANDENQVNEVFYLISQTMDEITAVPRKWAHLDNTIVADGTFYPMPGTALLAATNQVGWYGKNECNSEGEWIQSTTTTTTTLMPNQYPTLTTQFAARPLYGLIVCGDNIYGEYPRSFEIKVYALKTDTIPIHTEEVVDDVGIGWTLSKINVGDAQAVKWDKTLTVAINSCQKIELIIKKWNVGNRVVKISEFYTSITETYTDDDIVSMKLLEESEIADGSLPVGNMSCNEIDIKLQNVENQFFWGNTDSPIHEVLKINRKIKAWIGIELADSTIYYVLLGTFFSGDWQAEENGTTASTTARDRMELLRKSDYEVSELQENITLYDLALLVLNDAKTKIVDLEWNMSTDLQNFIIPYGYFIKQSYFKCIKNIVGACMGRAYMDRDDVLQIETDI